MGNSDRVRDVGTGSGVVVLGEVAQVRALARDILADEWRGGGGEGERRPRPDEDDEEGDEDDEGDEVENREFED